MATNYRQTYAQKLRDPRWQIKRLSIMKRDRFTCQICKDKETELQVHHEKYHGDPWEADNSSLTTLCCHCHSVVSKHLVKDERIDQARKCKVTGVYLVKTNKRVLQFIIYPTGVDFFFGISHEGLDRVYKFFKTKF